MGEILSIEADINQVEQALAGTSKSFETIRRQAVGIIAKGAVKKIKAVIQTSTQKRTGELLKAYRYKVRRDGTQANVFPKAINSDSTIYPKAMTLSYGHNGKTRRASSWHIKALGFVQSGKAWVDSGAYMPDLENMVDKELNKYWG